MNRGGAAAAAPAARLASPDEAIRIKALRELANLKEQAAPWAQPILARLVAGGAEEKRAAIAALGGIRTDTANIVPAMVNAMRGDAALRGEVLRAFETMGPGALPALPVLIGFLRGEDEPLLMPAMRAVAEIGPAAQPAAAVLGELVSRRGDAVKLGALYALNHLGTGAADALPALFEALGDANGKVRGEAAFALGQVYVGRSHCAALSPEAGAKLVAMLTDEHTEARQHAGYALAWARPVPAGAVRALTAALHDANYQVREQAARSLAKTGGSVAVAPVAAALTDSSDRVRQAAAWGLGELGGTARPALGALRTALSDDSIEVRRAAKRAIESIGK